MSRARLRQALTTRSLAAPALVPLVEAHAARLEQLNDDRWPVDAEAQARMLRAAQALYELDAVTIGGGGRLAAASCWLAEMPAIGASGARAAVVGGQVIPGLPPPGAVAAAASVALAADVARRLRPVLGARAGVALVLADAARLAAEVGRPDETGWAGEVLAELVRALGAVEPDLFLLAGDEPLGATLESLADFFGTPIVPIGAGAPDGVHAIDLAGALTASPGAWLHTTRSEIPRDADPTPLRAAFAALR